MGGADRPRRPHPGIGQPRVPARGLGPPRAGGAGAARRHADRDARQSPTRPLPARRRASRRRARCRSCATMLAQAERPFVMLGGGGWNAQACADIQAFAEANALPVGCTFRCQDLFDNRHPNYVGDVGVGINPQLAAAHPQRRPADRNRAAPGRMTTIDYTLIDIPRAEAEIRARACRRRGTGPRLPGRAADQLAACRSSRRRLAH